MPCARSVLKETTRLGRYGKFLSNLSIITFLFTIELWLMIDGEFSGIVLYRKMVEGQILLTIRKDGESIERTYQKVGWGIDPSKGCLLMSHEFVVQPSRRLAVVRCIH